MAEAARAGAIRMVGVEKTDGAMAEMIPVDVPADTMTGMTPADALGDMAIEMTLATGQAVMIRDEGATEAGPQIEGIVVGGELRLVLIPLESLD